MTMLSDAEKAILDFEGSWWLHPGPKDVAIEFTLGTGAAEYYQILLDLVGRPEARRYAPLALRRVRAMIEPLPEAKAAV